MSSGYVTAIGPNQRPQCPVCLSDVVDAKVLPCKHVACCRCLLTLVERGHLACPVCKVEKRFDAGSGVPDLPEPLMLGRIQQRVNSFLTSGRGNVPVRPCGCCRKSATHYCLTCARYFCASCSERHFTGGETLNHELMPLSKWAICQGHTPEVVTLYCNTCDHLLCPACLTRAHVNHDIVDIWEHNLKIAAAEKLQALISDTKRRSFNFDKYTSEMDMRKHRVHAAFDRTELRMRELRAQFIKVVDEQLALLKERRGEAKKQLQQHETEIRETLVVRDSLSSYITDVLNTSSTPEIIMAAKNFPNVTFNVIPKPPVYHVPASSHDVNVFTAACRNSVTYVPSDVTPRAHGKSPHVQTAVTGEEAARHQMECALRKQRREVNLHDQSGAVYESLDDVMSVRASVYDNIAPKSLLMAEPRWESSVCTASSTGGGSSSTGSSSTGSSSTGSSSTGSSAGAWDNLGHHVCWDPDEPGWWVKRLVGGEEVIQKYGAGGEEGRTLRPGVQNAGGMCYDAVRSALIVTEMGAGLAMICPRTGAVNKRLPIPDSASLFGIAHCAVSDTYVITDVISMNLRVLACRSGERVRTITTDLRFPLFVAVHTDKYASTRICVSDNVTHCVKLFSTGGQQLRRFGAEGGEGGEEGGLRNPCGVAVDPEGRVLVCDKGNTRVLRFPGEGRQEYDVALTFDLLGGRQPWCVALSPDGASMMVGVDGDEGEKVRVFSLKEEWAAPTVAPPTPGTGQRSEPPLASKGQKSESAPSDDVIYDDTGYDDNPYEETDFQGEQYYSEL